MLLRVSRFLFAEEFQWNLGLLVIKFLKSNGGICIYFKNLSITMITLIFHQIIISLKKCYCVLQQYSILKICLSLKILLNIFTCYSKTSLNDVTQWRHHRARNHTNQTNFQSKVDHRRLLPMLKHPSEVR